MLTPAEAEQLILANTAPFPSEDCPLTAAHGRVLRVAIKADRDLPPFDRVTMDGFALRSAELTAGARAFQVEGLQAAGMMPRELGAESGRCIEIMTGAVLPEGADCVVPYEETMRDGTTMTVKADVLPAAGNAIHRRASDHRAGDEIVPTGRRLSGREIAVAAACGAASVTVALQPKIAVIATGDELVDIGMPVAPHQVRRSNDYGLRAALLCAGYGRVERFHLRDLRHEIEQTLRGLIAEFDVLLLTGGVSKGKFDYLPAVLEEVRVKKIFHGVAQRPGKPLWFGVTERRAPVFALPGNPVSAYTCLHRYVLPALAKASGMPAAALRSAALAAPVKVSPKLTHFVPVRLASGARAELLAMPELSNTSGDFAGLVESDGFVELPAGVGEFPTGYIASYRSWDGSK